MSGLKDQFGSVDPGSLAGADDDIPQDDIVVDDVVVEPDEAAAAEVDEDGKPKGRSIDNVYGELSRKQAKLEGTISEVRNMMAGLVETFGQQPAQQQPKTGVEDYSLAELTAYRNTLTADDPQLGELDRVMADKRVDEKVNAKIDDITGQQAAREAQQTALREAVQKYPDLKKEGSDFWSAVDSELRRRGNNYAANNPHAILDVASYVAQRDSVTARATVRSPDRPGATKRDSAGKPVKSAEPELPMSIEKATEIAKKMERAMGRPFTDADIEKIRKNHAEYSQNQGLHVRQ